MEIFNLEKIVVRKLKEQSKNKTKVLRKSNKIVVVIMLINTISQLYFKKKKGANWEFSVTEEKNAGYSFDEIKQRIKEIELNNQGELVNKNNQNEQSFLNGSNLVPIQSRKISIADLMISFNILTAISHILILKIFFKKYNRWIQKDKINFIRWVEYSITSSIMILAISGLSNINSEHELIPIVILTGVTNMFGLAIESIKGCSNEYNNVRKLMFLSGTITQLYPWYRILKKLNAVLKQQKIYNKNVKTIIKSDNSEIDSNIKKNILQRIKNFEKYQSVIRFSTYGLFYNYFKFPMIMYKQYFTGPVTSEKYFDGELNYIVASILSKSFLSWSIFLGSLRTD
jgi:hypothetical protein